MEKLKNIEFGEWSKKAISNPLMKGNTIEFIFPVKFEKYCKIFHPFALSLEFDKMKGEWNRDSNSAHEFLEGKNIELVHAMHNYELKPQRLMAQIFNQKFDKRFSIDRIPKVWGNTQPKWLLCPAEGTLDESILPEITCILAKYSISQNCYFHYVDYAINTYEETIFEGLIEELPKTSDIGLAGTPNTVWPKSEDWYLYTNYDADYSLIGGKKELINAFISNEIIEALEWDVDDIFYPEN